MIYSPRRICLGGVLVPGLALARPTPLPHSNQPEQGTDDHGRHRRRRRNPDRLELRRFDLTTSRPDNDRFHLLQHSKPRLDWPIHLRQRPSTGLVRHRRTQLGQRQHPHPSPVRPGPILISRPTGVSAHHSFALWRSTPAQPRLRTRLPCSSFFLPELPNRHRLRLQPHPLPTNRSSCCLPRTSRTPRPQSTTSPPERIPPDNRLSSKELLDNTRTPTI